MSEAQNWRVEGFLPGAGWEDTGFRFISVSWQVAVKLLFMTPRTSAWPKLRLAQN